MGKLYRGKNYGDYMTGYVEACRQAHGSPEVLCVGAVCDRKVVFGIASCVEDGLFAVLDNLDGDLQCSDLKVVSGKRSLWIWMCFLHLL